MTTMAQTPTMKMLNILNIRLDGETQSRVRIDDGTVADYAQVLRDGGELPPVTVFFDGVDNWLADGFHRWHAYNGEKRASIPADVRSGSQREARLYSFGANGTHGLRRTNDDKRKAVTGMLADAEWSEWSDRKIAEQCGVSNTFVSNIRTPKVSTVDTTKQASAPVRVSTVDTPEADPATGDVASEKAEAVQRRSVMSAPAEATSDAPEYLAEAKQTIRELADEVEDLRTRLAVEQMDVSEDKKSAAAEIIADLRAEIAALREELRTTRISRDGFQRTVDEMQKQIKQMQRQAAKQAA